MGSQQIFFFFPDESYDQISVWKDPFSDILISCKRKIQITRETSEEGVLLL